MPLSAFTLWSSADRGPPAASYRRTTAAQSDERRRAAEAMDRYADGELSAFGEVYEALAARIFGYLLRLCRGDRALAEDLVQLTFLHVHRARGTFARGADVLPWIYAIARRLFIDGRRRASRDRAERVEDVVAIAPAVLAEQESTVDAKALAQRLADALTVLPESQRVAFELVKLEGLTVHEAASALGISESAVKVRTHRASEALRQAVTTSTAGGGRAR